MSREHSCRPDSVQDPHKPSSAALVRESESANKRNSLGKKTVTEPVTDTSCADETELKADSAVSNDNKRDLERCEHTTANSGKLSPSASRSQSPAKTSQSQSKLDDGQLLTGDSIPQDKKDPNCSECATHRPDPMPKDLVMYLHALRYQGPGWGYSTALPVWANPDWKQP